MTEEKFREIYHQYYRLVNKVIFSVLHDADFSEDVCQEVFLSFLEKGILWMRSITASGFWLMQRERPLISAGKHIRSMKSRLQHLAMRMKNIWEMQKNG